MSTVRHISDLHLNHKNIVKYSKGLRTGPSVEEHNEWLIRKFNSVVKKQDLTWIHGDIAFDKAGIELVRRLNGVKHLIIGNHDTFALMEYQKVFHKIHGFMKYKGFFLSHAPIREDSLRGRFNIHGHTHSPVLHEVGSKYINVSVEALDGVPIEHTKLELIRSGYDNPN